MLFNSASYLLFLPLVFLVYWLVLGKSIKAQNVFLMLASYFFYGCWDWRFLFLLMFSTALDYYSGIKIAESKSDKTRKLWFWASIVINLGFLGIFKYYNFFAESFADLLQLFGLKVNPYTLSIILPVGISFYTFHGLSYVIDIYKGRIKSEKNIVDYSLFVSFFPLLVAGPIERATHLLPQIKSKRTFDYSNAVSGLRQILWGLFKKIVIADNCAEYANMMFSNPDQYGGSTLLLGAIFFTFQIYGDFSGYSDIALGSARLLGFNLLKNFNFPYFSRDMAEFWRRWHISLSSWFKDYLYIPLGGSKGGTWMKVRNTFIIFLVSGFWHGANWTFIVWGGLNALFMMPSVIGGYNRNNMEIVAKGKYLPSFKELVQILITFFLTVCCWIVFRAESLTAALAYYKGIFNKSLLSIPSERPLILIGFIGLLLIVEWLGRSGNFGIERIDHIKIKLLRWLFYIFIICLLGMYGAFGSEEFIYFQF